MNQIETYFTMQGGKAIYPDIEKFKLAIACLPDGFYFNRIEKLFGKRTNPQNSYLWAVVYPAVQSGLLGVGYECTIEDVHEYCKNKFIDKRVGKRKRIVNKLTGELKYIKLPPSTRKLSTVEFNAYFERIIQWSAEYLGTIIPYPNEVLEYHE
jgi:hypothetical protein